MKGYNEHKDFVTLEAWKRCREVRNFFYKEIIPKLPNEEKYNLGTQIRKASVSITANIAEGYGRFHYSPCEILSIFISGNHRIVKYLVSNLENFFIIFISRGKEAVQFYRISRGSLFELKDHLISCKDFNYITKDLFNIGIDLIESAKITLNGYINYIKERIKHK